MPALTISLVRTLFITRNSSYPPIGGAPLRNWQNINIMMKFGPVAVFSISTRPQESSGNAEPPPGIAMWNIHHISDDLKPSLQEKIECQLRQLWLLRIRECSQTNKYYRSSIARELNRVLGEFKPHLVIFEELCVYSYLFIVKRHRCCIIYDAHNVEAFLYREIYKETHKSFKAKFKTSIEFAKIISIERDFIRQANQVWVCSEQDASLLQTLCRKALHAHVVPNGVDLAYYDSVRLGHHRLPSELEPVPLTMLFPANFSYRPNVLAAQLLLSEVYPRLQKVYPNCRLLLVGINPSKSMQEAAEKEAGIVVTGKVADMRPYLSAASTVVVPLLHGGGTRLKILEAFAAGRPVVSTSKGAEGLKVRDGEHLLIGDSADELAAGVCRLWSEASLGQKLAHSAYELVRTAYSWEMVDRRVEQASQELLGKSKNSHQIRC